MRLPPWACWVWDLWVLVIPTSGGSGGGGENAKALKLKNAGPPQLIWMAVPIIYFPGFIRIHRQERVFSKSAAPTS